MPANSKLEIQSVIEKILTKHNIDPTAQSYYLRLSMSSYMDLVIEKEGNQVLVGHYYEQVVGDTVCSFMEDGRRMIYPERIRGFMSFQRIFGKNIKEQGWLEDGERVEND